MEQNSNNLENNLTKNTEVKLEEDNQKIIETDFSKEVLNIKNNQNDTQNLQEEKQKNNNENNFSNTFLNEEEKEKLTKELTQKIALETAKKILGNVNPYNQKEFLSLQDLEEYFEQNAQKNKKNEQKTQNSQDLEDDWYIKDRIEFFKNNPDFTEEQFEKLLTNQEFIDFSKYMVGNEPLHIIYNEFNKYNEKIEKLANQKAQTLYRLKESSPGKLSSRFLTNNSFLENMSEHDFEKMIQDAKKGYYLNLK